MQVRIPFIPRMEPLRQIDIEIAPGGWRMTSKLGWQLESGKRAQAPFDSSRRVAWCEEPPFDRDSNEAYAYALRELNAAAVTLSSPMLDRPWGGIIFLASVPVDAELFQSPTIRIPEDASGAVNGGCVVHTQERFAWRGHDAFAWILWCADCRARHLADELCPFCL